MLKAANASRVEKSEFAEVMRPQVSIIIPMRNEAAHIVDCLDSVLAQEYPLDKIEILVIDGKSTDGSREIVSRLQEQCPIVKLFDNSKSIFPSAVNIGVHNSRGDLVIILSGHCAIARDYILRCVDRLGVTGADNVGGPIETTGVSFVGKAISLALSTPFGVGNAKFRYSQKEEYVDTLAFQCYRREVFGRIGQFDERLARNADIEFNSRLRKAGGRILLSPSIKAVYYGRSSLTGLCKQSFSNGVWNIRTYRLNSGSLSLRHFVPMLFTIGLFASSLLALLLSLGKILLFAILVPYAFLALFFSVRIGLRGGFSLAPLMPFVFLLLHLSYGAGSVCGFIELIVLSGAPTRTQKRT